MPQRVSRTEVRLPAGIDRRVEHGVSRLIDVASEGQAQARYVVVLLEAAAEEAEHRRQPAALPRAEQDIWEDAGATFRDGDAVAGTRIRTIAAFSDLVERSIRGDAALATLLGVDRSRISQRLAEHSIYAFEFEGDERCFPRWQLRSGKPLRGLRRILPSLNHLHPLTVDHWFCTPSVDLVGNDAAVSPVEWLATGGTPEALVGLLPDA